MSESSTRHADPRWPHPASEAARCDGRYGPGAGVTRDPGTEEPGD
ncbi:hypothetical protein [Pseudonocardia sp. HH130630-07]|nr:hypothetical protein [Pseudonocardia sp. HH130630-07]